MVKELFVLRSNVHGVGAVQFKWDPQGKFLASVGVNRRVNIFRRNGETYDEFALQEDGPVQQLQWDNEGEVLAVLQPQGQNITLYEIAAKKATLLPLTQQNPSYMVWSRTGPQLAVGTSKGNLIIYNKITRKRLPISGLHSKPIVCGSWNHENKLALASIDRTVSVSDTEGQTLDTTSLKAIPADLQFSDMKSDGRKNVFADETICINLARRTIIMYRLSQPDSPVELKFQAKYGNIVSFRWFADGFLLVAFSEGFVVAVNTSVDQLGEELHSFRVHESGMQDLMFCDNGTQFASCGDNQVKVVEVNNDWKQEVRSQTISFKPSADGTPIAVQWTSDGQVLTIGTSSGHIFNYLMSLTTLASSYLNKMCYLSSLREVTVTTVAQMGGVALTSQSAAFAAASATGTVPSTMSAAVTALAVEDAQAQPLVIPVAIEPAFLAAGPAHIAVGFNNRVWYYASQAGRTDLVAEQDYIGSVKSIHLNGKYASVLCSGKIHLHAIVPGSVDKEREMRHFPDKDEVEITCQAIAGDFLVYGTKHGSVHQFYLPDWGFVNEYRPSPTSPMANTGAGSAAFNFNGALAENAVLGGPVASIFPNTAGTRCVWVDEAHQAFLYSPVDDQRVVLPKFPSTARAVLWDPTDSSLFAVVDAGSQKNILTYSYAPVSMKGPHVVQISSTRSTPSDFAPAVLFNGVVYGQTSSGQPHHLVLSSHDSINLPPGSRYTQDKLRAAAVQLLALGRMREAWELCINIRTKDLYQQVARRALELLDIDFAVRAYRELGDVATVLMLQPLVESDDRSLVAGYVCVLNGQHNEAQTLFLASSRPITALEMRRDLLQWEAALRLAKTLAPAQVPAICRQYAQQLEFKAEYSQAAQYYQKALSEDAALLNQAVNAATASGAFQSAPGVFVDSTGASVQLGYESDADTINACRHGIARMMLRLGDLVKGKELALATQNSALIKECAFILDSMKQYGEAAELFVAAQLFERAAAIYIATKNFKAAAPLMKRITAPKLHSQFAKAKETEGAFVEAADSYEAAKDLDSVVRLLLGPLQNPQKAFAIVRRTRSAEGAALVASFCAHIGDVPAGIEFLLLAKRNEDAFKLAQAHDAMTAYASSLGEDGTNDEYMAIAAHFESKKAYVEASEYYSMCADFVRALKLCLQAGDDAGIQGAIQVIRKCAGRPEREALIRILHDFLTGDIDGKVKDPHHMFRLHMAIGDYAQAATTAILIAQQEQAAGNYKVAHSILFETQQDLSQQKIAVPRDMSRQLSLLHSYIISKRLVGRKEHTRAARMLLRVAKNISKFPAHVVPILTSTVVECQRANMKQSCYEYACVLMRPEYRDDIPEAFKQKIEKFVRRPSNEEEVESSSACPYCAFSIPDSLLDCPSCRNSIPYCITTGRHMVLDDWTVCPSCRFPTLHSAFTEAIQQEKVCPMCEQEIEVSQIAKMAMTAEQLMAANADPEEEGAEKPEDA